MKPVFFFIIVFVLIGSVSAIPNDADSSIDFTYPDSTNYSTINVNDSIYWDGNAWSDARWLNIDGGNANQNIDIGAWNFSASHFIGDGSLLTGIPSYWDRVGTVLSPSTVGDDITTTGNVHINRLFVNDYFFHTGDLDTYFGFGDNFAKISTGGETHFQINPSGNNIALGDDTHAMDIILRPTASGSVKIGADTGLYLGAADDSSISYDGTDMVINPKEVGTGSLKVLGDITTTGNVHINRLFVNDYFFHTGDLDTYFGFGDNFAKISTGGETHFQINPSGNNIALGDDTHAMDIILRPTASGSVKIGADTGLYLGAADDSSISYDGTDMVINPQEVGTGGLEVLGDLTTTGTGTFGDATIGNGYTGDCVNTTFVSGIATGCND